MRGILKTLMEMHGDDGYSLEAKSGVPQPTINRLMTGVHATIHSPTVKKIAAAYNINESQLRGDMPIEWLTIDRKVVQISDADANEENDYTLLQETLIAMIKSSDPKKITREKLRLIEMTLDAPEDKIPTLTTVTYAVSHPEQKYNAKKTKKKKQNGE